MSSKEVLIDGIPFPAEITRTKPLALVGQGLTSVEIHFLQIKYNAIGIYMDKDVTKYLKNWEGKKRTELEEDDRFFTALFLAPVEKVFRIVVIKEIKGSQYGVQLESAVRNQFAALDHDEDEEEEEALEKVTKFFESIYLKKGSITFDTEGKAESKIQVENTSVVEMIQKWYLGGSIAVSRSTIKNLAAKFEEILSQ
ncbi:hypothetical protein IEQ34_012610 [Dendrobium chrysotoxum]|uniref:Chalcone-flavonone isomerase family protein n=1 Tax=Dendrobium chrysotoxum TaxID=161865 RepID=A0AAV7GP87_DENCH|nr:hypothetical protein IEQ34_012610 [Dendrobium chrysotoxum]